MRIAGESVFAQQFARVDGQGPRGRAARWASTAVARRHGRRVVDSWAHCGAVIVDTETTDLDGHAVEIAVVDFATGATLLSTLVATDLPISAGAHRVHGIVARDLVHAPTMASVADQLRPILRGRPVLAYNAGFDRDVLQRSCAAAAVAPVAEGGQWRCLMRLVTAHRGATRFSRLEGTHRAAGDCVAARELVLATVTP